MTTKYADSELGNGVHTENGKASVTDSGGHGNTDSTRNSYYNTKTNHHPVDEGYAWVVLAACMVACFIIHGTFKSFGVLYVELIHIFHSNATMASIVQGILIFTCSAVSVFVLLFGLRFTTSRSWVIIGGFLYFSGFLISSFAGSVEFLFFSYSFLIGAGMALSFSSVVVIMGFYFKEKRGLASGLIMASGSLGGLLMAPGLRYLLDIYSVKGALLIMSAVASHIVVCGLLLRPPTFYDKIRKKSSHRETCSQLNEEEQGPLVPSKKRNIELFDRLYSSDPNIILKHSHLQRIERPRKSLSTEMMDKYPRTSEIYLCTSISAIDLNFDNNGTFMANSTARKQKIFNFHIFKNKAFLRLLFAYSVGSIGTALPQGYIPAFAMEQGVEASGAAWLLTIINFSDLLGRFFVGYISDKKLIKRIYLIAISMAISGTIQCLSPFYKNYWSIVLFTVFYGFFSNFISALYSPALLDILGLNDFRCALSVMFTGFGVISGVAAPFIGDLKDTSGTYTTCFYLFGSTHLISSGVLFSELLS